MKKIASSFALIATGIIIVLAYQQLFSIQKQTIDEVFNQVPVSNQQTSPQLQQKIVQQKFFK